MRPRCRPPPCAPTDRPWSELDELEALPLAPRLPPEWLSGDLIAGLTVWAVLVPEALAYATIAGVPPVVGLYAAPGALILYAVFGSSRHLIIGPMSATAALSAAVVGAVRDAGTRARSSTLTAALAVTAGMIGVIAGLLRLGFVANFISEPVLKGFIVGLALTIIAGQLPKLFGVEKGERRLLREDLGPDHEPRRHAVARRSSSDWCRSRSCSACGASCR